jgi:hypothetical protein
MGKISKTIAISLTIIVVMTCLTMLMAKPADAQSIPKPTVPEFTAKYVDSSYTVPAITTIDPYNGQNVTNPSHFVENRTLEIAIRNQPFTQYIDSSTGAEWKITLMYQIRTRGHFAQDWTNLSFVEDGFFAASNSDYTTVSYSIGEGSVWGNLQAKDQVDFQVEAMIGYVHRTVGFMSWFFTGESSDWSPIQTVTMPASSSSPSPTPNVPELSWLVIVPLLLSVFSVAVIMRYRKTRNLNN